MIVVNSLSKATDAKSFITAFAEVPYLVRAKSEHKFLQPKEWTEALLMAPLPIPKEFFIATQDGASFGRASVNLSLAYKDYAYFGFFEAKSFDVAQALIAEVRKWALEKNIKKIIGPINFNTWLPYRFRVNWDDSNYFAWEPQNPQTYPEYLEKLGFKTQASYTSTGYEPLVDLMNATEKNFTATSQQGYSYPEFDDSSLLKNIDQIHAVTMRAFAQNHLFEPLPLDYFKQFYVPLAKKEDHSHFRWMLSPQNEIVGYLFNFVDQGHFIMKSFAVVPEETGKGLSNACLHACLKKAHSLGIDKTVSALVIEGNRSESYGKKQKQIWQHRYCLYELEVSP